MEEIRNGTWFLINGEKWLYIKYIAKRHILASMERVEPSYFELGKFWTMETIDMTLSNEQMKEVVDKNPGWKNQKVIGDRKYGVEK